MSNSLGSIAVIYSGLHALASQWREEDDEIKCIATAGITGALYKARTLPPGWGRVGSGQGNPSILTLLVLSQADISESTQNHFELI